MHIRVRSVTYIPFRIFYDTSQLCRTGHDDVLRTRMTTLLIIPSELFPLMVSDAISCPLHNLKPFRI